MSLYSADSLASIHTLKSEAAHSQIDKVAFDKAEAIRELKRARVSDHAFRRAAYARGLEVAHNAEGQLQAIHKTLGIII